MEREIAHPIPSFPLGTKGSSPDGTAKSLPLCREQEVPAPLLRFSASVWSWDTSIKCLCRLTLCKAAIHAASGRVHLTSYRARGREEESWSERYSSYRSFWSSTKISSAAQVDLFVWPITGGDGFDSVLTCRWGNQILHRGNRAPGEGKSERGFRCLTRSRYSNAET